MIRLTLKHKRFGAEPVLGALDLEVAPHSTVALTGPSGIGKTTLLRILAGLDDDFAGQIESPDRIAMVFQEPTLLPWRTALQNITLVTRATRERALSCLGDVELNGLEDRLPGQLSLGQQRRLALARAFATDPQLLLLDEPFVSLDAELVDEMLTLTKRLLDARDIATVLVTHSETEAQRLATRIIRLGGSPATITSDRQNIGTNFQLSASGVTTSRS